MEGLISSMKEKLAIKTVSFLGQKVGGNIRLGFPKSQARVPSGVAPLPNSPRAEHRHRVATSWLRN